MWKILELISLPPIILGLWGSSYGQERPVSVAQNTGAVRVLTSICDMKLGNGWKLANLSFDILYSFQIDANGKANNIKKIRDDFVGPQEVSSCVSTWRIYGFPEGSRFVVYFTWKRGTGWTDQQISGEGFTQITKLDKTGIDRVNESLRE